MAIQTFSPTNAAVARSGRFTITSGLGFEGQSSEITFAFTGTGCEIYIGIYLNQFYYSVDGADFVLQSGVTDAYASIASGLTDTTHTVRIQLQYQMAPAQSALAIRVADGIRITGASPAISAWMPVDFSNERLIGSTLFQNAGEVLVATADDTKQTSPSAFGLANGSPLGTGVRFRAKSSGPTLRIYSGASPCKIALEVDGEIQATTSTLPGDFFWHWVQPVTGLDPNVEHDFAFVVSDDDSSSSGGGGKPRVLIDAVGVGTSGTWGTTYTPLPLVGFIGDSITCPANSGTTQLRFWDGYPFKTARAIGAWPKPIAELGQTTAGALAATYGTLNGAAPQPSKVVILLGANDNSGDANLQADSVSLYTQIRTANPSATIYVMDELPQTLHGASNPTAINPIHVTAIAAFADSNTQRITTDSTWLNITTQSGDQIHPNAAGHTSIAAKLSTLIADVADDNSSSSSDSSASSVSSASSNSSSSSSDAPQDPTGFTLRKGYYIHGSPTGAGGVALDSNFAQVGDDVESLEAALASKASTSALSAKADSSALTTHTALTTTAHGGIVPSSRTITTTAPLTGGGALTADLTLGVTLTAADVPNLDAAKITTGTINVARIPTAIPATSIGSGTIDNTEFGYLNGVTSSIQNQLDGKLNTFNMPAPVLLYSDTGGGIKNSAISLADAQNAVPLALSAVQPGSLGDMSAQNSNDVTITAGQITGVDTFVCVVNETGGTGQFSVDGNEAGTLFAISASGNLAFNYNGAANNTATFNPPCTFNASTVFVGPITCSDNANVFGLNVNGGVASIDETGAIQGATFTGNGASLTNLNGTNVTSGTVADARLSSNVPLKNAANTFTAQQTINVASDVVQQIVKGHTTQTANLQEWRNSSNQYVGSISNAGVMNFAAGGSGSAGWTFSPTTGAVYYDGGTNMIVMDQNGYVKFGSSTASNLRFQTNSTGLAFFGVTPVARQGATTDIKDALTNYGLIQGTSASPLNLDGGALTAGTAVLTASSAGYNLDVAPTTGHAYMRLFPQDGSGASLDFSGSFGQIDNKTGDFYITSANNIYFRTDGGTVRITVAPSTGLVTFANSVTVTQRITSGVVALTDGATISTDANLGNTFTVTLGGNRTMAAPTNATGGQRITYQIRQDATGSRTLTWNAAYRFGGGTAPTLTTTASKTDYIEFIYNATDSKWDCVRTALNF